MALTVSEAVRESFAAVLQALPSVRDAVAGNADVVTVRPGYDYPDDGDPVPSVVVAMTPGTDPVDAAELGQRVGVPVAVTDATVEEQLAQVEETPVAFGTPDGASVSPLEVLLREEEFIDFRPPKRGTYEPMDPPNLPLVEEEMGLTIAVSPEAGWSELESFLGATKKRLTVAMYLFTAPHIFEAIESAVTPGNRSFQLVLDPHTPTPPDTGIKANDLETESEVIEPLDGVMDERFDNTWATFKTIARPDGLWASAYHIKVAIRDGKAGWLSSGNWQTSNQPEVRLFGDNANLDELPEGFPGSYNREYHAIFENKTLASIYEQYIQRDFELCAEQAAEPVEFAAPDLFVPVEGEALEEPVVFGEEPQTFEPLRLERVVKVQPLLTPDNYAEHVVKLIKSAKESLWFQNQYINLKGTDDFPELRALVDALKEMVDDPDVEVRLICRNTMGQEMLDVLIAQGFPRKIFKFQPACHNKTIIVDKKVAMVGSHNWSNEGVATNRDASLIFHDKEIAEYLAGVFDDDWKFRANSKPRRRRERVAQPDEPTPPGFTRMPFSAVFDD